MNVLDRSDYIVTIAVNRWAWVPILTIVTAIAGFFIYLRFKRRLSVSNTLRLPRFDGQKIGSTMNDQDP
jgi:hypothetical protein